MLVISSGKQINPVNHCHGHKIHPFRIMKFVLLGHGNKDSCLDNARVANTRQWKGWKQLKARENFSH